MHKVIKSEAVNKLNESIKLPDISYFEETVSDSEIIDEEVDIIETSQKKYDDIIKKANAETEELKEKMLSIANEEKQRIISVAEKEVKDIFENAKQQGYTEARNEKAEAVDLLIKQVENTLEDLKRIQLLYMEDYAKELKWLSLEIAEKVIAQKIEENDMILMDIIKSVFKTVRDAKWITVQISKELPTLIEKVIKEMSVNECNSKIDVQTLQHVDKGTCIIQLEDRVIDASILTQLKNIEEFFKEEDEVNNAKSS